jgi:outer membrane protein assembly factor BamB
MKKLASALVGLLLSATVVSAQNPARLYTTPSVPSQEDLDRLNLKRAWYVRLPMDGRRDGLFSMQIHDKQLVVLQRSGNVVALDAATGATQWRNRVGVPYVPAVGFGSNSKLVFVAKGVNIFALDRKDGKLVWNFHLPHAPSASPVADEEHFYIPLGTNKLHAYSLPDLNAPQKAPVATELRKEEPEEAPPPSAADAAGFYGRRGGSAFGVSGQSLQSISAVSARGRKLGSIGALATARQATQVETAAGPQPESMWDYMTETRPETRLEQTSILTGDYLFQAGANGLFFAMSKFEPRIYYQFQADASVSAPIGGWGELAYVPSDDFRVYALDIVHGRILWRFVGGGPIRQKPRVTDDSLYVTAERAGLYRLDRATGDILWRNGDASRFLAVNNKFLYATDITGRMLILDRARGTELGSYDGARDFVVPLSNELNDRIYLASNDGLLVALHDRDYPAPVRVKNVPELKPSVARSEPKKPAAEKAPAKPTSKTKPKEEEN